MGMPRSSEASRGEGVERRESAYGALRKSADCRRSAAARCVAIGGAGRFVVELSSANREVGDAIGEVCNAIGQVSDAIGQVGDAIGDPGDAIGEVGDAIGDLCVAIGEVGDAIERAARCDRPAGRPEGRPGLFCGSSPSRSLVFTPRSREHFCS